MPNLTFKCAISSTMVPFINLQGQPVRLSQSGTTWSGSLTNDVGDTLVIAYTVTGITASPWTVDITVDCPGGPPAKIFSSNGNIPHGGSEGHTTSAKVATNPCAAKVEVATAELAIAPEKLLPKSPKKRAKKTNNTPRKS
jgi:hypothetical protein